MHFSGMKASSRSILILISCIWQMNFMASAEIRRNIDGIADSHFEYYATFEIAVDNAGRAERCKYKSSPNGIERPTKRHIKLFRRSIVGVKFAEENETISEKRRVIFYNMPYGGIKN